MELLSDIIELTVTILVGGIIIWVIAKAIFSIENDHHF